MNIKMILDSNLTVIERDSIIDLKEQHWLFGRESQEEWMKNNLQPDDIHMLGYSGGVLQAYLNAVNVKCNIDGEVVNCFGVGNVCVDKTIEHTGYGKQLIEEVNRFLTVSDKIGILLCHKEVQGFYKKCGWKELAADTVTIDGKPYFNKTMTFSTRKLQHPNMIDISKNF